VTPPPGPADGLAGYAGLLATTGVEWGLIGPSEADRIWDRHIDNSLALAGLIGPGARVVDVGSGAGLPGIPLALARPDLEVTLVEPLARRVRFLELALAELGLEDRVTVVRARAEAVRLTAEVVVARAVAPLERLVGWTRHLLPTRANSQLSTELSTELSTGELLALKGAKAAAEVADAAAALRRWGLAAETLAVATPAGASATVVRVRPAA
jgi:16S rRNA (guanine527-N7)-methyltransferase